MTSIVLMEILWAALHDYLAGHKLKTGDSGGHQWPGFRVVFSSSFYWFVSYGELAITDYRPVIRLWTKLIMPDGIGNDQVEQVAEDCQLTDCGDVQAIFCQY